MNIQEHNYIYDNLKCLSPDLIDQILISSEVKTISVGEYLLKEGQNVKTIPLVISGLVRVYIGNDAKEMLLYYLNSSESCIMLLNAGLNGLPSRINAVAEEDTIVLLFPVDRIQKWMKEYNELSSLFMHQYDLRYNDMLDTIYSLLFDKIDDRLYKFLKERVQITNKNPIKLSHRQIATEIGTVREVVTRVLKRLEKEGKIFQDSCSIRVL